MVHSDTIDAEEIAFWARRSSKVLKDLEQRLSSDRPSLTAQRRAWMEMNDGDDVRGSRPDDDHARAVVERYGGIRKSGNYRFPDGSVLQVRRGRIVASPDPVRSKYSCGFPMVSRPDPPLEVHDSLRKDAAGGLSEVISSTQPR